MQASIIIIIYIKCDNNYSVIPECKQQINRYALFHNEAGIA